MNTLTDEYTGRSFAGESDPASCRVPAVAHGPGPPHVRCTPPSRPGRSGSRPAFGRFSDTDHAEQRSKCDRLGRLRRTPFASPADDRTLKTGSESCKENWLNPL